MASVWVEIAKNYKSEENSISWMNLLKVWLYLIDNKQEVIKTSEIAEELGLSKDSMLSAATSKSYKLHSTG